MHPCLIKYLAKVLALAAISRFRGSLCCGTGDSASPAAAPQGWEAQPKSMESSALEQEIEELKPELKPFLISPPTPHRPPILLRLSGSKWPSLRCPCGQAMDRSSCEATATTLCLFSLLHHLPHPLPSLLLGVFCEQEWYHINLPSCFVF